MKREGKKTPTGELSSLPIGEGKFSYKVRGREAPTRERKVLGVPIHNLTKLYNVKW